MEPRWYQTEAVDAPFSYWSRESLPPLASPCIEVPTGGGKSAIIGWTAKRLVEEHDCRIIVATHRSELIEQDAQDMREVWPQAPIGILSASLHRREFSPRVVIAGVQTAYRQAKKLGHRDVMIIDEAHLVATGEGTQYQRLIAGLRETNPDMRLIGYTATPYRMGQGYITSGPDALFSAIPYRVDIQRLIADGHLSTAVPGAASVAIDTAGVGLSGGEFNLADLELAANVEHVTEHVADDVSALIRSGRKAALVYGVSIVHAAMLRNALQMRGVACETITGEMDRATRKAVIARFRAGQTQALTSCDVLTTGFNVPSVDVVALVRPTQSTALYVQIVGRGLRTAPGKKDCVVLDYGGNIARHGPIDAIRVKAKVRSDKEKVAPTKECPACFADVPPASRSCPHCDFEFPPPERKANARPSAANVLTTPAERAAALKAEAEARKPKRHEVGSVMVHRHEKRGGGGAPTVRLDYYAPDKNDDSIGKKIASEWLCFDHEPGFARDRADAWWVDNVGTHLPESVDEAVQRLRTGEFPRVMAITTKPDGEFTRVLKVIQERPREPGEDEPDDEPDRAAPTTIAEAFGDDDIPF